MPLLFSKPDKLDHADTILYEIDMLRFSVGRLRESVWREPRDAWVYLEAFLVHYRSLIEFLGSQTPKPKPNRPNSLHITTIWKLASIPEPRNLADIYTKGTELWRKYEPSDEDGGGRISQYLQHPTEKRIDPKNWPISMMNEQIEPLLTEVEKHLRPGNAILTAVLPVEFLGPFSASTTVATITASVMPDFDVSVKKQFN